jgi:hypothetical protein
MACDFSRSGLSGNPPRSGLRLFQIARTEEHPGTARGKAKRKPAAFRAGAADHCNIYWHKYS